MKKYKIIINGIAYQVAKPIYDLIEQLNKENQDMVELLGDAFFINRELDNIDLVSQISIFN